MLSLAHKILEDKRGIRFVLTGSSARKLKRSGVDLLAGRAALRRMHPFTAAELGPALNLGRAVVQGMLPLVVDAPDPHEVLRGYTSLYLREEVQPEGMDRNLRGFARFLEAISLSHASLLNLAEVARECEVSRTTVEGYMHVIDDLLLSFRIAVFARRARRQLSLTPSSTG